MKKIKIFKLLLLLVVLFLSACFNKTPQATEKLNIRPLFADTISLNMKKPEFKTDELSEESYIFKGHTKLIYSIAITPSGKYVISASRDKIIKLWDINTGELIRNFEGHTSYVYSVAITPDGKYIVSGSKDKTIKLWNIHTGKLLKTIKRHKGSVRSVAITPNGQYIVSGSYDKTIKLWDIDTGKLLRSFKGHKDGVKSVAITPDGKYIVSGSKDKTIRLWNIKTGKFVRSFKGHTKTVYSVAITPDGKHIVSGSRDRTIKAWDINTGKLLGTFKTHKYSVRSVAITSDGQYVISGSNDKTIKLWDIHTGEVIKGFDGHTDSVNSIAVTPDGKYIVSGSNDNTIKLWNINIGGLVRDFEKSEDQANLVAITPDKKYVVSGNRDKTIKLWDTSTGILIKTFKGHKDGVTSVAITPNGKYIVSGSDDKTIKLWELDTGRLISTFRGHKEAVASVAITPDGKYIVSGSDDKTIKLWDIVIDNKFDKKAKLAWNKFVETYTASSDDLIALKILATKYPNIKDIKHNLKQLSRFISFQYLTQDQQTDYLRLNSKDRELFVTLDKKKQIEFLKTTPVKKAWLRVFTLVDRDMDNYLNKSFTPMGKPPTPPIVTSIPSVPDPDLPPVEKLRKSTFESKAMFDNKLSSMKKRRAKQIKNIVNYYRKKVNLRNKKAKIAQGIYGDEYNEYKKAFAKYKAQEMEKYLKYKDKLNDHRLVENRSKIEQKLLPAYYSLVFGEAKLKALADENNEPRYNAETGIMYAMLYWGDEKRPLNEKEISFLVKASSGKAEDFYNALEQGEIIPSVKLSFKDRKFTVDKVEAKYQNKVYLANLKTEGSVAQKPVKIKLGYKYKKADQLKNIIALTPKPKQKIYLQNLKIKDVQFEIAIANELKKFKKKP